MKKVDLKFMKVKWLFYRFLKIPLSHDCAQYSAARKLLGYMNSVLGEYFSLGSFDNITQ
jgi:hypothetical protein